MDKIKKYIIIFVCVIIIIMILIFLLNFKQENEYNKKIMEGDPGETIELTNKIEYVDDFSTFKTVEQCIQQYYNILNNRSSSFYGKDEDGNEIKIFSDTEIRQIRLDLLSDEYKNDNNININNIDKYIKTSEEQFEILILKMKQINNTNVEKYIAQGIITNIDNKFIGEFYIIVNLDIYNETFSIEPIIDQYNDIDEIKTENLNKAIEINNNNKYEKMVYSYEDMSRSYFSKFKRLIMVKPEIVYNDYMDAEYKSKRFGNFQEFQKYVNNNKDELSKIIIKEYLVNNYDNYTEYVVKDQNQNLYIFNKYEGQKLNVMLDTYTIMNDKFKQTYLKSDDVKKIQMNIDKFFQMINRQDYKSSYNCLDEQFKNNYFKTAEKFEDFAKNKFFLYNKISFKNYEKKGSGLYIINLEISNMIEDTEKKEINIIIKLNEDLDFKMSFGM